MKQGWVITELGNVCSFENGDRGKNYPSRSKFVEDGIPFVNAGHLRDGYINMEGMNFISEAVYNSLGSGKFADGDVLFCLRGSLGKYGTVTNGLKGAIASSLVIVKHGDDCLSEFLAYYFQSKVCEQMIKKYAGGAAQPNLGAKDLAKFQIPIPPLPEQKRIVAKLDQTFEAIDQAKANVERNLQNAKDLFQSHLQSVFDDGQLNVDDGKWEEKTLKEISTKLGDGLHGTPLYTDNGEYYFINGNNLNDGEIIFKERTKRVSFSEYEKHKKTLTCRTVFVSINGTLGNVAFYNDEKIILGKSACYFNLIEGVDKNFIKYTIMSPQFIQYMHTEATGATIKNVSLKSMRAYKVLLPPLNEQRSIVNRMDSITSKTKILQRNFTKKLSELTELKKSILQKAFNGEL